MASVDSEQLEIFNREYKGHNPYREVSRRIPAGNRSVMPAVPVTMSNMYSWTSIAATMIRMLRSTNPIFFFIDEILSKSVSGPPQNS